MSEHHFILKPSLIPTAGVGCFASRHIAAGAQLSPGFEENFRKLTEDEIPDEYLKYCVLLKSGLFLSPHNFLRMGVFWYINHAKYPNVLFENGKLYARTDIEAQEELTLYYSDLLTHPKNKLWINASHI
jgi:hypothetical protein